jgi:thioredoxin 1
LSQGALRGAFGHLLFEGAGGDTGQPYQVTKERGMPGEENEPTRDEVDRMPGPVVLEFGASWCPYCQATRPDVDRLLAQVPQVRHIWIEDGKGKPLGRSFRVKLWPTLVFLRDGKVLGQAVRPEVREIEQGLEAITN